jgi:hypothetical protein
MLGSGEQFRKFVGIQTDFVGESLQDQVARFFITVCRSAQAFLAFADDALPRGRREDFRHHATPQNAPASAFKSSGIHFHTKKCSTSKNLGARAGLRP